MTFPCTGVILSGGLSTRFNGQNKAFISVGQRRILDRLYDVFSGLFDEIILVTNHPLQFLEWDLTIVTDIYPVRSSLTGIHTGLFYMKNPFAFFSACDTPFLKKELGLERPELLSALNSLTGLQKDVIILRFVEDMDYSSIAEIFKKSRGTIRGIVFRAIEKIRKEMSAIDG